MNETGKRYACTTCGAELLVTRGGAGSVHCCGRPMQIRGPGGVLTPAPGTQSTAKEG
jgi:desulfoferrodoxin-like iron-binding protein